jgi:hypothetical protein
MFLPFKSSSPVVEENTQAPGDGEVGEYRKHSEWRRKKLTTTVNQCYAHVVLEVNGLR